MEGHQRRACAAGLAGVTDGHVPSLRAGHDLRIESFGVVQGRRLDGGRGDCEQREHEERDETAHGQLQETGIYLVIHARTPRGQGCSTYPELHTCRACR